MPIVHKKSELFGILLTLSAGVLLVGAVLQWLRADPEIGGVFAGPGGLECLKEIGKEGSTGSGEVRKAPLVVQAEAFARYLDPPKPQTTDARNPEPSATRRIPPVRPPTVASLFRLRATCYCPSHPDKSRALVWEPSDDGRNLRWVEEGTSLGHFVVQEIRPGAVLCVNGEQRHEMKVEHLSLPVWLVEHQVMEVARVGSPLETNRAIADVNAAGEGTP